MAEAVGDRLGQYEIRAVLRRGELSTIYVAAQPSLGRLVAIKMLPPVADSHFEARFQLEARSIARLQHPNILQVYDYGEQDGRLYLVTPYIEGGRTLADRTGERGEPADVLRLMSLVLDALEHAHEQGIVHRDVKPSNILLPSPDWPVLADFGIVKLLAGADDPGLTQAGIVIGTPGYMAPEQAMGTAVDARTDLYAVGVVLYQLLTGQLPFEADTPLAALARHIHERPPRPRSINPSLPESVEAMLLRALAKDPADRFQSAGAMRAELDRLAEAADPPPAVTRPLPPPAPPSPASTVRQSVSTSPLPPPAPAPPPLISTFTEQPRALAPEPEAPPPTGSPRAVVVAWAAVALAGVALVALGLVAFLTNRPRDQRQVTVAQEQVTVSQEQFDTGIDVSAGDLVTISATGEIDDDSNPDTPGFTPDGIDDPDNHPGDVFPGINHAALVAKIGDSGNVGQVGRSGSFTADQDGRLFLGVNDGKFDDNSGAYSADITVTRP